MHLKTERHSGPEVIDYTPASAVTAGTPIQIANRVGIAASDIAANALGSLQMEGLFRGALAAVTIVAGDKLGWDANGSPYGGVALSGCYTNVPADWDFPVGTALFAATNTSGKVIFTLNEDGLPGLLGVGGYKPGSIAVAAATLAIPVTHGVVNKTLPAGAEALTLANGTPGQRLKIILATAGGGLGTLTPTTKTGFTAILFLGAKDQADLLFVDAAIGWIITGYAGTDAPPVIT